MYYLCLNCGEIYTSKHLPNNSNDLRCPKASCRNELVEIDELMLPIVKKLMDLGYHTRYCCSGHCFESIICSYLIVNSDDLIPVPNAFCHFPPTWEIKFFESDYAFYPKVLDFDDNTNLIKKQKQIFKIISDLMDWVETLPSIKQEE